jgi:hypothetical protein
MSINNGHGVLFASFYTKITDRTISIRVKALIPAAGGDGTNV